MIVVMAAFGSDEMVCSPRQVWCFSPPDAWQIAEQLSGEYAAEDDMEVFSVDFPEVGTVALQHPAWHRTAEDCTRMTLAMYLKSKQHEFE